MIFKKRLNTAKYNCNWSNWFRIINRSNKVSFELLSGLLSGFSGADIENLANEAAILSVRYNETQITNKIIMDAFEKSTIGHPTKVETRSNSVLKMVSYHEMGHTLVAMMFDELFHQKFQKYHCRLW